MTQRSRIAAILGLVLMGVVAVFPPLKRPPNFPTGGSMNILGCRGFLLSFEYTYYTYNARGEKTGWDGAEIDIGRLFAEALVIIAAAGVILMALAGTRTNSKDNTGPGA
jgi:hypothetical protein